MIKRLTTRDYIFRLIISLILAILVWYSISGSSNTVITRDYTNIPVILTNESSLKEKGLIIDKNLQYYVNLEIRGTESNLDAIDQDDLIAKLSLADVNSAGSQNIPVVIEGLNNSVILEKTIPNSIQVPVEEIKEKEFTPDIIPEGKPADTYSVITAKTDQKVKVDGPNGQIDRIDRISGVVNVDGLSSNSYQYVNLSAYDAEGNILDDITLEPSTVETEVLIGVTKEVSINNPQITNFSAADYQVSKIELNPTAVTIAGNPDLINTVNRLDLTPIDLSGKQQDSTYPTNSELVIPEGVSIIGRTTEVSVDVYIEKISDKSITVSDFDVIGLADDLDVQRIDPGTVNISVSGTRTELSKIDSSNVKANIDVTGLREGSYTEPVNINLEGVTINLINPATVNIVLSKKS